MARGGYRPGSGPVKGTKYGPRGTGKKSKEKVKQGVPVDIIAEAEAENLDPLTYMLKVMNDTTVDAARRDRMAISAAPFCHARKGEGAGKKDERAEKAKSAGAGKFAAGKAPISLVK